MPIIFRFGWLADSMIRSLVECGWIVICMAEIMVEMLVRILMNWNFCMMIENMRMNLEVIGYMLGILVCISAAGSRIKIYC